MSARPEPFSVYTTPEFWDDPHISAQMLRHHLDPMSPAASRTHAFIDRSVDWLHTVLDLRPGSRVLDLGCGPGLYATKLARRGIEVVGMGASTRSVAHARATAEAEGLPVTIVHGNYLTDDLGSHDDAAILIYEDYSALSPAQRAVLLRRVWAALRPGGQFVFDVTAAPRFDEFSDERRLGIEATTEFWAPRPYHGVHETWTYPELRLVLDRYMITKDGRTREFWNWMHCLRLDQVTREIAGSGFELVDVHGDVAGAPFDAEAPTFAACVSRPSDRGTQ